MFLKIISIIIIIITSSSSSSIIDFTVWTPIRWNWAIGEGKHSLLESHQALPPPWCLQVWAH